MIVWRICQAKWTKGAFSGEGARHAPGRWNSAGRPVVYLAESRSLAALEVLAHVEDIALLHETEWVTIRVEIPDGLIVRPKRLPKDWDSIPLPQSTAALGDAWLASDGSLALCVPSVVTKGEFNVLLNPQHADFRRAKIHEAIPFRFDARIPPKPTAK